MKKFFLLVLFCFPVLLFGQRYIKGRVIDGATNKPFSLDTIRLIGSDNTDIKVLTDSLGYYKIDSNHFSAKVNYVISAEKYLPSLYYSVKGGRNIVAKGNIKIDTITENLRLFHVSDVELPRCVFSKDSFHVTKGMQDTVLDFWYFILLGHPQLGIEIDAHTDQTELHPMELSLERAQICRDYIISKGIDSARILAKGWGSKRPIIEKKQISYAITQDQKDSLYQINRRAVFQIRSLGYSKK